MYRAYLHSLHPIQAHQIADILNVYPTVEEAVLDRFSKLTSSYWMRVHLKIPKHGILEAARTFQDKLNNENIVYIGNNDPRYPQQFASLDKPPAGIFVRGNTECFNKPSLTVVGARNLNSQTLSLMNHLLRDVTKTGIGIWSGLAYGVDTEAHNIALIDSWTGAAIGSGIDEKSIYPAVNRNLAHAIVDKKGIMLSEYPPGTEPATFHFPQRNRLLAALGNKLLVIQAGKKSGSLITVDFAHTIKKHILTPPAFPFLKDFEGNNELIKSGKADIVTCAQDILDAYGMTQKVEEKVQKTVALPTQQKIIYDTLNWEPTSVEMISAQTKIGVAQCQMTLTQLELIGLSAHQGSNEWVKV
jgi:DNA processing protein